jgi:hypothetical protein
MDTMKRVELHGRSTGASVNRDAPPARPKKSLKELLLAMPEAGEDADFERRPDHGRDVEL